MVFSSVKEWYRANRSEILVIISACIAFISILNLYSIFTIARHSNDECLWRNVGPKSEMPAKTIWRFESIKPGGVTDKAGIREGDLLRKINNVPITSDWQAQYLINEMVEGSTAVYTVERNGTVLNLPVKIKKLFSSPNFSVAIFSLIWFLVGYILITAKPAGEIQRLFYKVGVSFSIYTAMPILFPFLPRISYHPLFSIFLVLYIIVSALLPYWYIQFFGIFPVRNRFITHRITRIVLLTILSAIAVYTFIRYAFPSGFVPGYPERQLDSLNISIVIGLLIAAQNASIYAGFILFLIGFIRIKEKEKRKQIAAIAIANSLGIASYIFVTIIAPRMGYIMFNSPEYYAPVVLIALVPIAFGYSIFKYELLDVSAVVKNTVISGAAILVIGVLYLLIVFGLGSAIGGLVPISYQNIVTLFFFVLFALIFQSTKDRLVNAISKRFYPEQYAYHQKMSSFHRELAQVIGLNNILQKLFEFFTDTLKVRKFGIALYQHTENKFSIVKTKDIDLDIQQLCVDQPELELFIRERATGGKTPIIEQSSFELFFGKCSDSMIQQGIYTIIPLIAGETDIGFVLLGLKYSGSQFGANDAEYLSAICSQAAISIENARLYDAEGEKLKLERDMELARKIQQSLLPTILPQSPRVDIYGEMIPALHVGGDYFDIIPNGNEGMFIIVGDVAGKGLPSALYMAKIQTLVQMECRATNSPKQILTRLNDHIYNTLDKHIYITMILSYFDYHSNILFVCRAGHLPLLRKEGVSIIETKPKGMGIGLADTEIFTSNLVEEKIIVQPGQLYVFFSDGIIETMDSDRSLFGETNLAECLSRANGMSCKDLVQSVFDRVTEFRGSFAPHDDMTLVMMKIIN